MNSNTTAVAIERYGWVTKEEPLSILSDPNLDLQIMIFESAAPFFGYYADEPGEDKPEHLYWVLDQFYTHEMLTRALVELKSQCYPKLDAVPGYISVANEHFHVVRMHNLKRYSQIHAVQDMFEKMDIRLRKITRRIHKQMGIININKFLNLLPVEDGIYLEGERPHRAYFTLPAFVSWDDFKLITREVKIDTSLLFFDAARAAYLEQGKITELVRIYRENLTIEQLKVIRERYLRVMRQRL
jgi:hypothetical protein